MSAVVRHRLVGALDLGGSHVSVALVDTSLRDLVPDTVRRVPLDPHGAAEPVVEAIGEAMAAVDDPEVQAWALAVPGAFDYARGIALYRGVGKFDALYGVDLRAALGARVAAGPDGLTFLNDADAFALGEWAVGAVEGVERCVGVTLGSGVGSAFLRDGTVVDAGPEVPPEGSLHLLAWEGRPLEDTVSRRALRHAYSGAAGSGPDVAELAALARAGDERAATVFSTAFAALGQVLGPWLLRFGADAVVLGGSISRSWDLVVPPIAEGLAATAAHARVLPAARLDDAPLLGAGLSQVRP